MKEFECDCGFKWLEGKSGHHQCGAYYMEKVDGLKQELADANMENEHYRGLLFSTQGASLADMQAKAVIEFLNKHAPRLNPFDDISLAEEKYHCELALYNERERLHGLVNKLGDNNE